MANIDDALTERFQRHAGDHQHRESVIVTLAPGGKVEELADLGMAVTMSTRDGRIVAGTVTRKACDTISRLGSVLRVEPEGEMHALE
jgi:hypothetical protein